MITVSHRKMREVARLAAVLIELAVGVWRLLIC